VKALAAALAILLALILLQSDAGSLGTIVLRVLLKSGYNIFGDGHKSLVNVDVQLRGCLEKLDFKFVG
jgi:hypothetical protein